MPGGGRKVTQPLSSFTPPGEATIGLEHVGVTLVAAQACGDRSDIW